MSLVIRNGLTSRGKATDGAISMLAVSGTWLITRIYVIIILVTLTGKCLRHFNKTPVQEIWHNDGDQVLGFMRGELLFVFNFSPTQSFTDYGFLVPTGSYNILLDTDNKKFGGNGLNDDEMTHLTNYDPLYLEEHKEWLKLYLPARSALVLKKN